MSTTVGRQALVGEIVAAANPINDATVLVFWNEGHTVTRQFPSPVAEDRSDGSIGLEHKAVHVFARDLARHLIDSGRQTSVLGQVLLQRRRRGRRQRDAFIGHGVIEVICVTGDSDHNADYHERLQYQRADVSAGTRGSFRLPDLSSHVVEIQAISNKRWKNPLQEEERRRQDNEAGN